MNHIRIEYVIYTDKEMKASPKSSTVKKKKDK